MTEAFYAEGDVSLWCGDAATVLDEMPAWSVDALVVDPPYGLGDVPDVRVMLESWLAGQDFRPAGKGMLSNEWDAFVPAPAVWAKVLRVLKPGAYGVVFAGSRTYDLVAMSLRLAGFDVRDSIHWFYSTGFSKAWDVARLIDAAEGVTERDPLTEVVGPTLLEDGGERVVTRKGSLASSFDHGKGQWARGYRETREFELYRATSEQAKKWEGFATQLRPVYEPCALVRKPMAGGIATNLKEHGVGALNVPGCRVDGRVPANVVLTHAPGCREAWCEPGCVVSDIGAALYVFVAKPSSEERDRGLGELNAHATVKPIELMRWLVRLVTPPGGLVLDCYAGTGTTGIACSMEERRFWGVEREQRWCSVAVQRMGAWGVQLRLPL